MNRIKIRKGRSRRKRRRNWGTNKEEEDEKEEKKGKRYGADKKTLVFESRGMYVMVFG